jgi:hypothetical protein
VRQNRREHQDEEGSNARSTAHEPSVQYND